MLHIVYITQLQADCPTTVVGDACYENTTRLRESFSRVLEDPQGVKSRRPLPKSSHTLRYDDLSLLESFPGLENLYLIEVSPMWPNEQCSIVFTEVYLCMEIKFTSVFFPWKLIRISLLLFSPSICISFLKTNIAVKISVTSDQSVFIINLFEIQLCISS